MTNARRTRHVTIAPPFTFWNLLKATRLQRQDFHSFKAISGVDTSNHPGDIFNGEYAYRLISRPQGRVYHISSEQHFRGTVHSLLWLVSIPIEYGLPCTVSPVPIRVRIMGPRTRVRGAAEHPGSGIQGSVGILEQVTRFRRNTMLLNQCYCTSS